MIRDLFKKGQQLLLDEAVAEEATKTGKLRGGNTSMINAKGDIIGQCANLTYLRYKGVSVDPVTPSRDLMFDAGRRNEDHWYQILSKSLPDGLDIIREEETPTKWETTDGTPVTGRPDIVLVNENGPVVGIELKQASSLWTLRDVVFQKKPKLAHLMQAAHYSWQLGCPFELWYTSRSDFAVTGDWAKNLFPKAGEPGSEHCQYAFYREGEINPRTKKPIKHRITEHEYTLLRAKGEKVYCDILKILPTVQGYELDLADGRLYYKDAMVDDSDWIETIVRIEDIKRFYEKITTMEKENVVQPEPKLLDVTGKKLSYKASSYCSLGELCCGKCEGQDLDQWIDKIKSRD